MCDRNLQHCPGPGMQRAEAEGASGAAPDAGPDVTAAQPAEQAPANALWTDKYRPGSAEEVCLPQAWSSA